jgi:DNA-directed RNA polymerase subunit RPC12/RpoP
MPTHDFHCYECRRNFTASKRSGEQFPRCKHCGSKMVSYVNIANQNDLGDYYGKDVKDEH